MYTSRRGVSTFLCRAASTAPPALRGPIGSAVLASRLAGMMPVEYKSTRARFRVGLVCQSSRTALQSDQCALVLSLRRFLTLKLAGISAGAAIQHGGQEGAPSKEL